MDIDNKRIFKRTAVAFVMRLLGAALNFLMTVIVARRLGLAGAGLFFLAVTLLNVATVFGRLGLDNAMLRFASESIARDEKAHLVGLYRTGFGIALAASAVTTLLLISSAGFLANSVFDKPDLAGPARLIAIATIPLVIALLHGELLKARRCVGRAQFVQAVMLPGLTVIVLLFLPDTLGPGGVSTVYSAGAVGAALMAVLMWRQTGFRMHHECVTFPANRLLDTSLPLLWVSSLNLLGGWSATFLLGIWGSLEDVGTFSTAFRAAMLPALVLFATNSVVAPRFARHFVEKWAG